MEADKHRSTMISYVQLYGIMMCQHMDARYVLQEKELAFLKDHIFALAA
ncbi:hypothetical protein ACUL41_14615 [Virgibacillus natechei]